MYKNEPTNTPKKEVKITIPISCVEKKIKAPLYPIKKAFDLELTIKSKTLNEISYKNFDGRIRPFEKWLITSKIRLNKDIREINKKIVIQYLNDVLQKSSARNRNNTRTDISSLFQTLEDNEVIQDNFVKN